MLESKCNRAFNVFKQAFLHCIGKQSCKLNTHNFDSLRWSIIVSCQNKFNEMKVLMNLKSEIFKHNFKTTEKMIQSSHKIKVIQFSASMPLSFF
jgi:hypothetical protein